MPSIAAQVSSTSWPRGRTILLSRLLSFYGFALSIAGPVAASETAFAADAMAVLKEQSLFSTGPAYTVDSIVLPRFDGPSAWSTLERQAGGQNFNATRHTGFTGWLAPESMQSLGVSLGVTSLVPSAGAQAFSPPAMPVSLGAGIRWRSKLEKGRHLDVLAWAQAPRQSYSPDTLDMIWQTQQASYGTRVEVQWASSRTRGLVPEFGAIGMQLQGGSRLVLRARKGGPMLYYRAKF